MSQELVQQKAKNLQALLEVSKKQIEAALPKHLTPERLLRIAMTEARKNPALLECTQASFIGAIIQTAQLGLEPGGALGHSYLVPFKNKNAGTREVQLIVGYRGMMDLAYRSPKVSHVIARAVYKGDKFVYQYGFDERLDHNPDPLAEGKELTHVYAIVFLKEGGKIFEVMEVKEIEAARKRSKSADSGPWDTDYEAMAKKSVVRKLFKYMPVSIELQTAVGIDEAGERGDQKNGDFIETVGKTVETTQAPPAAFTESINQPMAEEPAPVFHTEEDEGAFGKFQGGRVDAPPPRDQGELVMEVFQAAEQCGMDLKKLVAHCKKQFKKEPNKMTVPELETALDDLKKLFKAMSVK
jgi:recombination protein RecT